MNPSDKDRAEAIKLVNDWPRDRGSILTTPDGDWLRNAIATALASARAAPADGEADRVHLMRQVVALREAASPVLDAIKHEDSSVLVDENWNPDAHVEIVLTVAECKELNSALSSPQREKKGGGAE